MAETTSDTPNTPAPVTLTEPAPPPAPDAPHVEPPLEVPAPAGPVVDGSGADPAPAADPAPDTPADPGFHVEPGASAPSDPDGLLTTETRQTEVQDALDAPRTDIPPVDVIEIVELDARDDPGMVLDPAPATVAAGPAGQLDRIEEKLDRIVGLFDQAGAFDDGPAPAGPPPADPTPAL